MLRAFIILAAVGFVVAVGLLAYVAAVLSGELERLWWAPLVYAVPAVFFALAIITASGRFTQLPHRALVIFGLLCIGPFMVFAALGGPSGIVVAALLAAFVALWLLVLRRNGPNKRLQSDARNARA